MFLLLMNNIDSVTGKEQRKAKREGISHDNEFIRKNRVQMLSRQMMLDRFYVEEQTRSEGGSGVKQTRVQTYGSKSYFSETHTSTGVCAIHDHANNRLTIGMGEIIAVLNGVEFRTRHNDFGLNMPSTTSRDYHATEEIPLPPVPQSVLSKETVEAQIEEMKAYFKAFAEQDDSVYDYKPYFKPALCYMEGKWVKSKVSIDESFVSDRHFLDAKTWQDMENKIMFNSYTGGKETKENQAYLPTKIIEISDTSLPIVAQWSYRILCHPLAKDLPLDAFQVVDDLASRMKSGLPLTEFTNLRAARFQMAGEKVRRKSETRTNLLDELMQEIPGLDNYGRNLYDDAYGVNSYSASYAMNPLNAAYYHRSYKKAEADAMGRNNRIRGYSDTNLFVAMNTQDEVVGMTLNDCSRKKKQVDCHKYHQKWSFAIPLEIIYLTPLSNWNPYNITYHGKDNKLPSNGNRNGKTNQTAYFGTSQRKFYRTPTEFFSPSDDVDKADTGSGNVWVEDQAGVPHLVQASGHRIKLRPIEGVGEIRQRWPIPPVHGEGSTFQKEIDALKDIVLNPISNTHMFYEELDLMQSRSSNSSSNNTGLLVYTTGAASEEFGSHSHEVVLNSDKLTLLQEGNIISTMTEEANGHSHSLRVTGYEDDEDGEFHVVIIKCDKHKVRCADGHEGELEAVPVSEMP